MNASHSSGSRDQTSAETAENRLRALWEDHSGRVLAYAIRRLGSKDAAEDIVSETFIVAWRKIDEIPEEPLPWLLGTAHRVLAHHHRSGRSRASLQTRLELVARCAGNSDSTAEDGCEREHVLEAFRSLSDTDQEALILVDWEGLRNREAATVLGISAMTFTVRLHRARRRLGAALTRGEGGDMNNVIATKRIEETE